MSHSNHTVLHFRAPFLTVQRLWHSTDTAVGCIHRFPVDSSQQTTTFEVENGKPEHKLGGEKIAKLLRVREKRRFRWQPPFHCIRNRAHMIVHYRPIHICRKAGVART